MTIARALSQGIRSLNRRKRLCFWFYAVTTIWALAVAIPAITLLADTLGDSAWADSMTKSFDIQLIGELVARHGTLPLMPLMAFALAVLAIASTAHLFLLGGALQLFTSGEDFSMTAFFGGSGRHFWRFVRLALLAGLFYAVVMLVNRLLDRIGQKLWGEGSAATPFVHWGWFRTAFMLLLLGLVGLIFDYARIHLVATGSRKSARAALAAVRFVFANLRRTAGLYFALWVVALIPLGIYLGLSNVLSQIVVLFAVRQIVVLIRMWTGLLFYSAEVEMYGALWPKPVAAPVPAELPAPEPVLVEVPPAVEAPVAEVPPAEPAPAATTPEDASVGPPT